MIKDLQLTRVKWNSESSYIFVTLGRQLNGQEIEFLCEKYASNHKSNGVAKFWLKLAIID